MSELSIKLATIKQKEEKLLQLKTKLIEKRKKEIANLAERCGLLEADDEIITGLFIDCENAIKLKDNRLKEWRLVGEKFLNPTKQNIKEIIKN